MTITPSGLSPQSPNTPPVTDLTKINQIITTYLYSKGYLKQATEVVLDTSGKYSWPQKQNAYNFIQAYKNGTDFTSTFDIGGGFSAGVQIHLSLFKGNSIIQAAGSQIAAAVDTALQQIQGTMEDPSNASSPSTALIYDSQTKHPATMYDMLHNPGDGFYFEWTHNLDDGDNGSPNWCQKSFIDTTIKNAGRVVSTEDTDAAGSHIPYGGISNSMSLNSDHDVVFTETAQNSACFAPYMQANVVNAGALNQAEATIADVLATLKN